MNTEKLYLIGTICSIPFMGAAGGTVSLLESSPTFYLRDSVTSDIYRCIKMGRTRDDFDNISFNKQVKVFGNFIRLDFFEASRNVNENITTEIFLLVGENIKNKTNIVNGLFFEIESFENINSLGN